MREVFILFSVPGMHMIQRDRANIYYTFTPNPLFDRVIIKTDEELSMLLSKAHRLLGILEGISWVKENIDVIEAMSIKREAVFSCQTEGIRVIAKDILYPEKKRVKYTEDVSRYIEAIEYGMEKINEGYSNKLLSDLYRALNGVESNNKNHSFREGQIFNIPGVFMNIETYNPTAPEDIKPAMLDLEKYIKEKPQVDELAKIGLVIYQYITISPYDIDNKRLGRLMLPLLLKDCKVLSRHLLCFSDFVLQDKVGFYNHLAAVRFAGDYREWIKHFVKGVIFASEKVIQRINDMTRLKEENLKKICAIGDTNEHVVKLLKYMEKNPMFNIKMAAAGIGLSYNTTAKAVNALQGLGIVEQENQLSRNRCYVYREYMNIAFG